jgi:EmrB/QacA subfamily drug resistance transporter
MNKTRLIFFTVAFGVFVAADDLTAVSTMLRQMVFDLEIPLPDGLDQAVWIVNAYLIAYLAVMPFMGRVSDLWGRRPVFIAAMLIFLVGSIWTPLAGSLESLIFGRVLTAIGGGAMVPVAMAVIGDIYPPEKRATGYGLLGGIETAGWVWGPLYGALLVRYLSWRWQFYLNIPLAVIGLILAWYALRHLPPPARRGRIDWLGAGLLTVGLIALNTALLNSGNISVVDELADLVGRQPLVTWPYYLAAAVSLGLFALVQRRVADPLLDLRLFTRPNFSPAMIVNLLVGSVLIIAMVNVPLVVNIMEFDIGQAALDSGRLLSAMTATMALLAYLGGRWTEKSGYRLVTAVGLAFTIVAFLFMGSQWTADVSYAEMGWQLALLGIGFGLITAPIAAAAINAAPDSERGVAASLVIVLRLIGMSVGLSGLTAWGLYRFEILRGQIELPAMTDPGFQAAIIQELTNASIQALTEAFLLAAGIMIVALIIGLRLRPEQSIGDNTRLRRANK